ncbi:hypothetical protein RFI_23393, partial [Reticulomyxa filosa]
MMATGDNDISPIRPDWAPADETRDVLHIFISLRVHEVDQTSDVFADFYLGKFAALTHEFRLESEWAVKISEFFTINTNQFSSKPMTDRNTTNVSNKIDDSDKDDMKKTAPLAFEIKVEGHTKHPSSYPELQNITNVYVNAYDCCLSYNPLGVKEQLVLACEKIRITTNVVPLSPMISFGIDLRDGAVFLHSNAKKMRWSTLYELFSGHNCEQVSNVNTQWNNMVDRKKWELLSLTGMAELSHPSPSFLLPPCSPHRRPVDMIEQFDIERGNVPQLCNPFLHLLPGNLLSDHLESIGFVRVLDFDWIDTFIAQARTSSKNEITISGGLVRFGTCQDSAKAMVSILTYFIDQVLVAPDIEEFQVFIPNDRSKQQKEPTAPLVVHVDAQSESKEEKEEKLAVLEDNNLTFSHQEDLVVMAELGKLTLTPREHRHNEKEEEEEEEEEE